MITSTKTSSDSLHQSTVESSRGGTLPTEHGCELPADQFECNVLSMNDFLVCLRNGDYVEGYRMDMNANVVSKVVPDIIKHVPEEFADAMPDELPDGLPPVRPIEHDVVMQPGAQPSARAPFRHSEVERSALCDFVQKILDQKWIDKSFSPWVSNIVAVPKKDPTTGLIPKCIDWVQVTDIAKLLRWVIDYLDVTSLSAVPCIPLPYIDELFARMVGAVIFSTLDLLS